MWAIFFAPPLWFLVGLGPPCFLAAPSFGQDPTQATHFTCKFCHDQFTLRHNVNRAFVCERCHKKGRQADERWNAEASLTRVTMTPALIGPRQGYQASLPCPCRFWTGCQGYLCFSAPPADASWLPQINKSCPLCKHSAVIPERPLRELLSFSRKHKPKGFVFVGLKVQHVKLDCKYCTPLVPVRGLCFHHRLLPLLM